MSLPSSNLQCFAHINAPNAALYSEIVTAFAKARVEFQLNLRAAEVVSRLAGAHVEEDVAAALDQLCTWGNLEAFNDSSQALSLQEFYRRHLYYQLTGPGVAALRAIELFHQLVETPASLQATALAAVRDRLAELIGMAKAQEDDPAIAFDLAKASSLMEGLFTELENLTNQAQEFFRGLQATVELRETSVDAFLSFKDRLVHYLERFLNQVVTVAGEAETMIDAADEMMIDALLHSIARHRTIDELDVTTQRIEQVQCQLHARWLGVVGWFVAPSGRTSQADELRSLARTGIREVAAAATRLNRGRGGVVDRSADFRRLAVWFANCADARAAHRLWRTAFAVSPARHLTVSDATLAEREQSPVPATSSWADSPPLRIAPTLRKSGRVARSARTPRLIDNRSELESLREQCRQEAEELSLAQEELHTPRCRLSELPPLSEQAFPLLLDLLGEALTKRGAAGETITAASTDGSMLICLEPTGDDSRCRLETRWGEFRLLVVRKSVAITLRGMIGKRHSEVILLASLQPSDPPTAALLMNFQGGRPELVRRTLDGIPVQLQHVRIDLCRAHVVVPHQFLNRANVNSVGQQMCGERMPKCVAASGFVQLQFQHRRPHCFLHE